jgi:zinc/manganese transport system substrate-binding protein
MQDVHHIQARPSLIAKSRRADLLFCTGAELEAGWLPVLLRKANNRVIQPGNIGHLMATDYVELLEQRQSVDRSEGDVHAAGNPHIQTNPHNMLPVARELTRRLSLIDPEGATDYRERLADFEQRFSAAIIDWEQRAAPLKDARLVTHHKSWIYLLEWLGMESAGTLEPKPGIPPSTGHLAQLLEQLSQTPADMIIHASYRDDRAAQWLSGRSGTVVVAVPESVGGTEKASDLFGFYDDLVGRLLKGIE